jgi:hypothetical protein
MTGGQMHEKISPFCLTWQTSVMQDFLVAKTSKSQIAEEKQKPPGKATSGVHQSV